MHWLFVSWKGLAAGALFRSVNTQADSSDNVQFLEGVFSAGDAFLAGAAWFLKGEKRQNSSSDVCSMDVSASVLSIWSGMLFTKSMPIT